MLWGYINTHLVWFVGLQLLTYAETVSEQKFVSTLSLSLSLSVARWGRCQEGYGEDPFLQGQLATQYIKALQNSPTSSYVQAVVSTVLSFNK